MRGVRRPQAFGARSGSHRSSSRACATVAHHALDLALASEVVQTACAARDVTRDRCRVRASPASPIAIAPASRSASDAIVLTRHHSMSSFIMVRKTRIARQTR